MGTISHIKTIKKCWWKSILIKQPKEAEEELVTEDDQVTERAELQAQIAQLPIENQAEDCLYIHFRERMRHQIGWFHILRLLELVLHDLKLLERPLRSKTVLRTLTKY